MLTENKGADDSAALAAEADAGIAEFSGGAPPQAVRTIPSVNIRVSVRAEPGSKLICLAASQASDSGYPAAVPDRRGPD